MLQQILRDMWIDPDLLAELGEDQKQILFCKMREEQVRRWKIWDQQQNSPVQPREASKVRFKLGADGEPWTWVMGEHPTDRTIEQILEDEAREKARQLAEKEAQELRKSVEAELSEILDMNQKQIVQLEAAKELNRLKGRISPLTINRKNLDEPEIFSINDQFSKYKPGKIEMIEKAGLKVSTAVAQWEQKVMEERTSVIFCQLRRKQLEATKEAEDREKKEESAWREQEKKAKEAECQIREIARRAREEHRRASYCETDLQSREEKIPPSSPISTSPTSPLESLSIVGAPVAASRPPNRTSIIEWFRGSELNRGAGVNDHNTPEPWFHGLISRQDAERLLSDKPVGSFLVRISERIWGYAITYRDADRFKHYLIDASNAHYQFLGADQIHHSSLAALVQFYEKQPITTLGGELLRSPCPPEKIPEVLRDQSAVVTSR